MFRNRINNIFRLFTKSYRRKALTKLPKILPVAAVATVFCEQSDHNKSWDEDSLGHEFLIRQATTVNVNAASQLLTVTLVAIQDTSERLREALSREISLVKQIIEWGEESTPPQHWDELVAIRNLLADLNHNLRMLLSYMEYAEKLATASAELSYLSGNVAASDAICERIDHANRTCKTQKELNHELQHESLQLQQKAIVSNPEDKTTTDNNK